MANRLLLGIHFIFHQHTPEQAAVCLAFHQQTTDELGGDQLGGAGEEGLGECCEGLGGYGSGFETCLLSRLIIGPKKHP